MIPTEAQTAVKTFFTNPAVAKIVTERVLTNKPASWGKTSNAPYFNSKYAKEIQPFVDAVIVSRKDLVFLYSNYPSLSPKTVYLRINQSLLFLCECMNEDFRYSNYKNMTVCEVEPRVGLRFTFKPEFQDGLDAVNQPMIVEPMSRTYVWREKIDLFLNDPTKTELFIDKLLLSPQQMEDVRSSMPLDGVIASVTAHTVRIIKTSI